MTQILILDLRFVVTLTSQRKPRTDISLTRNPKRTFTIANRELRLNSVEFCVVIYVTGALNSAIYANLHVSKSD